MNYIREGGLWCCGVVLWCCGVMGVMYMENENKKKSGLSPRQVSIL